MGSGPFDSRWLEQRDLGKLSAKPEFGPSRFLGPSFKALTLAQKPKSIAEPWTHFFFVCNLLLFVKKNQPTQIKYG